MSALKRVYETGAALRRIAPVDDDFPEAMHKFDTALRVMAGLPELPKVICLCGSTKFKAQFDDMNYRLTMAGHIVLSVGFFMHATGNEHGGHIGATPEQKMALDELHKRKIDLADEVFVINVGGYVGDSTRSEIEYARRHFKPIVYLEPPRD